MILKKGKKNHFKQTSNIETGFKGFLSNALTLVSLSIYLDMYDRSNNKLYHKYSENQKKKKF